MIEKNLLMLPRPELRYPTSHDNLKRAVRQLLPYCARAVLFRLVGEFRSGHCPSAKLPGKSHTLRQSARLKVCRRLNSTGHNTIRKVNAASL
jgi:hypothetical protein